MNLFSNVSKRVFMLLLAVVVFFVVLPLLSAFADLERDEPQNTSINEETYLETFPDANFRREVLRVLNQGDGFKTDKSIVSESDMAILATFTNLDFSYSNINDMTGLSYFIGLEQLWCDNNQLTTLDISNNSQLWYLDCSNNQLSSLDISNNPLLRYLVCNGNQLKSLDVSQNTALAFLGCTENLMLSPDDVIGWQEVGHNFYFYPQKIIGEQGMFLVEFPDADFRRIVLGILNDDGGFRTDTSIISESDIAMLATITQLDVSYRDNLSDMSGLSYFSGLTDLECDQCQLTTLDVSGNPLLRYLNCGDNQLSSLDVSQNLVLETLYCYRNQLTCLDISQNTKIVDLSCFSNYMYSTDAVIGWQALGLVLEDTIFFTPQRYTALLPIAISGNVLYQPSLTPATVTLFDNAGSFIAETTTTADGYYSLIAPAGNYTLIITKPDYFSYTIKNLWLISDTQLETIDICHLTGDFGDDVIVEMRARVRLGFVSDFFYTSNGRRIILDGKELPCTTVAPRERRGLYLYRQIDGAVWLSGYSPNPYLPYIADGTPLVWNSSYASYNGIRLYSIPVLQIFAEEIFGLGGAVEGIVEDYGYSSIKIGGLSYNTGDAYIYSFEDRNEVTNLRDLKGKLVVVVYDGYEAQYIMAFSNVFEAAQYQEAFPDANFRAEVLWMLNLDGGNRTDNSIINAADTSVMASFSYLDVSYKGIRDMTGLQYLSGLRYLSCENNLLTSLDVSKNTALQYLVCSYNLMVSPDNVIGWRELGLIINSPEDMYSGNFLFYPQMTSPFIPVTDITSVPTEATAGVPLLLSGTVFPAKATNQTITWSVNDAGSTGATIEGDTLTATAAGTVVITATVEDGLEDGVSYAKDFTVTVYEELIEEYNFTVYFNSPPTPYSPGDTVYVDILLEGDLNFTMAEVSAAYDTDLLEYLGYENVSGWMNQIYREGSDLITVRNLPTSNLNAGAPCTEPVRLLTLKFKVKNTLPEDEVKTDVSFAAINVYPTPNITDATTAPGKSLTITLNDLI
ncbi:MAG: carboxypeptidase regulatory-like domain-containing protein [Clostridiales bacterium]|nr:carboxypeptidase regulatory-like domain-containing protein [Clostridiales bacterium]